jgi:two-component system, cell cycle sensor histidine kinase and response regulator CckA
MQELTSPAHADARPPTEGDSLGNLAGGVAHEFNNLLTAIIGHTELLSEYFADGDPRAAELAGIRHATELASSVTRQLLAFSRMQVLHPIVLDLNEIVEKTRRILARVITEPIDVVVDPAPHLQLVLADPAQMEQMLLNLTLNARDAMPTGGRLLLRTRNVDISRRETGQSGVGTGRYVELIVADNGTGMDEHVRARLFEPFFTTKDRGRGTGLGLAAVQGIVTQSGGYIAVDTAEGEGTTITVRLPAAKPAQDAQDVNGEAAPSVLLVENDEAVRGLIEDVLRRRGYTLVVADGGQRALEMTERAAGVDLLITDVVTADMNGPAVARAIQARWPSVRVLFVSGYADGVTLPAGAARARTAVLQKPFTPDGLLRKIKALLEI